MVGDFQANRISHSQVTKLLLLPDVNHCFANIRGGWKWHCGLEEQHRKKHILPEMPVSAGQACNVAHA
eukprot:scaffold55369_cov42-Prasinocladus_malaysianus.AAC.2